MVGSKIIIVIVDTVPCLYTRWLCDRLYPKAKRHKVRGSKDQRAKYRAPSFMPPRRRAVRGLCRSSADSARVTPLTASSALANPNEIHALRAPCGWLSFAPSLSRRNTHPRKPQAAKRACTTTSAEALIILIARVSVSSRAYPPALVRNASVINIPTSCD